MLKICLNCGSEFEGSSQARFHSDACRKAYSRRELGQVEVLAGPELGQGPALERTRTVDELIAFSRSGGALSAAEEQRIRDHFGFASSETRSLAERDAVAARITGKRTAPLTEEEYVRRALSHPQLFDRARAETYARWRYRCFVNGEVASL